MKTCSPGPRSDGSHVLATVFGEAPGAGAHRLLDASMWQFTQFHRYRAAPLALAALLAVSLSGCSFYSFSGATIPSDLQTIAIPIAQDNSVNPVNTLDRQITDLLTDRFVGRTRLSLSTNEATADALLDVVITGYQNQPTAVTGEEVASQNEVSIRARIEYIDQANGETLLSQSFTNSAQYDPVEQGAAGEEEAAQVALERLADDVFTAATSNW